MGLLCVSVIFVVAQSRVAAAANFIELNRNFLTREWVPCAVRGLGLLILGLFL